MEREEAAKWDHVSSRWQTRLLAVECVRRLMAVVQHPYHFDLAKARDSGERAERYLIEMLGELVSVAFTASTAPLEAMRPVGVVMLFDLSDKFGEAEDPDYEGKRLLELYSAQISAALRPCFAPEAEPSLCAAGCASAARYLLATSSSADGHGVDPVAVRKLLGLLTKLCSPTELSSLRYPEYSESAATMVRAAALQASAQLLQACAPADAPYAELRTQLEPSLPGMRDCWLGLLRDLALLDTQPKTARRSYRPFLYVSATARAAHPQLLAAWPSVLSAVVATVGMGAAWTGGREGAISAFDEAADPSAAAAAMGSVDLAGGADPSGGAADVRPLVARPLAEDGRLLLGVCSHRVAIYAEAIHSGGSVGEEEREEALLALSSLQALLPALPEASLPPPACLRLAELLRAATLCAADTPTLGALAGVIRSLCTHAGSGALAGATPEEVGQCLAPLTALAASPLLRMMPHLAELGAVGSGGSGFGGGGGGATALSPPSVPPEEDALPILLEAVQAVAALPAGIRDAATRLSLLPSALLLCLHTCHAASVCTPPSEPLAAAAAAAARTLLAAAAAAPAAALAGAGGDAEVSALASSPVVCACLGTCLQLLERTPSASSSHLLAASLACASALPDPSAAESSSLLGQLHSRLEALLASPSPPDQTIALSAVQAELQRASAAAGAGGGGSGGGLPPVVLGYLRALLPAVAPLLLRSTPLSAADKPSALRLLLLACATAPPSALVAMLSLSLPLIISCLWLAADGTPAPEQHALTTLAHTSLTALAKRSPTEFRNAAANFSAETRVRMETSLREQQQAASAPAPRAGGAVAASAASASKPKIALTMNFGAFGK